MAYEDPPLTPPKGRGRGWGSVSDINQESALDENTDTHFFALVETPYLAHDVGLAGVAVAGIATLLALRQHRLGQPTWCRR